MSARSYIIHENPAALDHSDTLILLIGRLPLNEFAILLESLLISDRAFLRPFHSPRGVLCRLTEAF
jgi:hypothetical protein